MKWFRSKKIVDDAVEHAPLMIPGTTNKSPWLLSHGVVESLRYMLTRVTHVQPIPSRVALIAAQRGEGVTYLAQALGAVMAHDLMCSVAVVSLNWWNTTSHLSGMFSTSVTGLADVLTDKKEIDEVMVSTGLPNLTLIPAGILAPQQRPVIARSEALEKLLDRLEEDFDHLIFDIPALLATSDAIPLASLSNACCLVIQQGVTPVNQIRLALNEIPHLPILGVIMNQVKTYTPAPILKFIPQT